MANKDSHATWSYADITLDDKLSKETFEERAESNRKKTDKFFEDLKSNVRSRISLTTRPKGQNTKLMRTSLVRDI
ncbi:hypothetical protein E4U23_006693 [Claviceps purpurea]|nr:hypothetical protein E4U28_008538 [Claviceps purpurea]KAG6243000.1 hypothetical protein E4U23_006693 [Claviceps purpurea]